MPELDRFDEAARLRAAAWHHLEFGNFETAELLLARAFELENERPAQVNAAVIL